MAVVGTDYSEAPDPPSTGWQTSVDEPDELIYPEYEIFMLGGDDYDEELHTGGYLNEARPRPLISCRTPYIASYKKRTRELQLFNLGSCAPFCS